MDKLKLAVLGMNHGYKFACDAKKNPEVELVAVAGDNEFSENRAKKLNVTLYKDYKKLIEECDLDGVIIALPNSLHREAVEICADKGCDVLVEKPISVSIDDGEAIIEVCKRKNVKLLIGHHRRFSTILIKLREIINSGELGEIVGVNMLWVLAKDHDYFFETWRKNNCGGPLLINGIHDIDDLRFVTGFRFESVYAAANNNIRKFSVEDSASVILETTNGVIINYFLSDAVPSPWNYEANTYEDPSKYPFDENCYQIFGTRGSISFPSMKIYYYNENEYGWKHKLLTRKVKVEKNDPMTAELNHFIDLLKGDSKPFVTGEDALETLKLIDVIKESALRKQRLLIP